MGHGVANRYGIGTGGVNLIELIIVEHGALIGRPIACRGRRQTSRFAPSGNTI